MLRLILTILATIGAGITLRYGNPSPNLAVAIYGTWLYVTMDFVTINLYKKNLLNYLFNE